ncbi:hypothetical protein ACRWF7_17995, partial [Escherichia coli]
IRCVCGKKIGPDPRNFNQRVSLGRNDLLIRTFLKAIMMKYAGKNEQESDKLFFSSVLFNNLKIESYNDVTFYSHEVEYHWAMLIAYGELYWEKGISSQEPEGYFEWEAQYRKNHNLAEESFEFNY